MRDALIGHVDVAAAVDGLRRLSVNYDEADAPVAHQPRNWHVDHPWALIGHEPAGPPVPGGAWEIACGLVRAYEFSDPGIVRAVYRPSQELLGRDMLLEGRFLVLRFYLGVRVTEVVDETRDGQRVWGWGYQTLEGHLEQGKLVYEVVKDLRSGDVELQIRAYSRARRSRTRSCGLASRYSGGARNSNSTTRSGGGCAARCRRSYAAPNHRYRR